MEDQEPDQCWTASNLALEDVQVLKSTVARVRFCHGEDASLLFSTFKRIISRYQEQPQLLDPLLETLVRPLSATILDVATQSNAASDGRSSGLDRATRELVTNVSRFLWFLASVRGYKTVSRFMPNDASAFEPAIFLLDAFAMHTEEVAIASGRERMDGAVAQDAEAWETQYALLMWLSLLVLIPFDLYILDSSLGAQDSGEGKKDAVAPVAQLLVDTCLGFLSSSGPTREMSSVVLGRLLTRPDLGPALLEFTHWGVDMLERATGVCRQGEQTDGIVQLGDSIQTSFLLPGVTLSFATLLKIGEREAMDVVARRVAGPAIDLLSSKHAANNALTRKLAIKLVQRAALTFLPKRSAAWRYKKGRRVFLVTQNLPNVSRSWPREESEDAEDQLAPWMDDLQQSELVESSIDAILNTLGDRDTVVRWSAAKGLGRIVDRLPLSLGDEVITAVLDSFENPLADDATWHGGCLALAEFARRGLLLPSRLLEALAFVKRGLAYEIRRGHCSVGANVRDASAYVCWAVARAYSADALGSAVDTLAPALITTAIFDREITCRRAAAAAFQECVGRLGSFPCGIEILTAADYFTVTLRSSAYTSVGPKVASYPGYFEPLTFHLLKVKLHHWDKSVRELSAKALARLVSLQRAFFVNQALPYLIPLCTDPVLETRHGAIAAIAELLPVLKATKPSRDDVTKAPNDAFLTLELTEAIANIIPSIRNMRLTKGKGGEVIRGTLCQLIDAICTTGIDTDPPQQKCMYDTCFENLYHTNSDIQQLAASSLAALAERCVAASRCEEHGGSRAFTTLDDLSKSSAAPTTTTTTTATTSQDVAKGSKENESNDIAMCTTCLLKRLIDELDSSHPVTTRRGAALALGKLPPTILFVDHVAVLKALSIGCRMEDDIDLRDVETRVNSVTALSSSMSSMWNHRSSHAADWLCPGGSLVLESVVEPLLRSMEDYTVDNRGDVGSWVREAAMKSIRQVLCILKQTGRVQDMLPVDVVVHVVGIVVRQALERISRIRATAMDALNAILPLLSSEGIECAAKAYEVVRAIGNTDDIASGNALAPLMGLLHVREIRTHLLEGIIYSIGGLDAQLSEKAKEALLGSLSTSCCTAEEVGHDLLQIWARHGRSGRMSTPMLVASEILVSQSDVAIVCKADSQVYDSAFGCVDKDVDASGNSERAARDDVEPDVCGFVPRLLFFVRKELVGCTDIPRLHAGAAVLCQLSIVTTGALQKEVLRMAVGVIGNRYPKVRRYAAEQLYTALLAWDMDGADDAGNEDFSSPSGVDIDQAMDILMATAWDGPASVVRPARIKLCQCLGLPPPPNRAEENNEEKRETKGLSTQDENASYKALLHHVERGL